jgi:glycine amidinotransferase
VTSVSSFNEWDPLEEVIVGTTRGAVRQAYEPALAPYFARDDQERQSAGGHFSADELDRAEQQLDTLAKRLEHEGVSVRRPEPVAQDVSVSTPDFAIPCGHAQACPRDALLVIGDEIIEVPMAQRARFFEYRAYRPLLKEYFRDGARWTAAPRPQLADELYAGGYTTEDEPYDFTGHPSLTECEPVFDAASFIRCGRDIFWQPDVVSNQFGADWLARHLGSAYRIHKLEFVDRYPQHIDTTFVPLRPGLALINPERPFKDPALPGWFAAHGWQLVRAVPSVRTGEPTIREVSNWISMNVLSLDEHTIVAEAAEEPLAELLTSLGFTVIPVEFDAVFQFGGSFHCCTLDTRRRGELQSYFGL